MHQELIVHRAYNLKSSFLFCFPRLGSKHGQIDVYILSTRLFLICEFHSFQLEIDQQYSNPRTDFPCRSGR
jgi:hypothetical protein